MSTPPSDPSKHEALIAPSMLSADFAALGAGLARAEAAGGDWHHVDIMDGHFVPNLTVGPAVVAALAKVATIPLDVHLMIRDPFAFAGAFLDAGAAGLTFHVEVGGDLGALLVETRERGARSALALNPETPVDAVLPFLDRCDMILVMSVHPGFAGQAFLPEVCGKVRALRGTHGFEGRVQMDGGITRANVALCAAAGADVLVAGSALYGAADMRAEIGVFRERIGAAGRG